MTVKPTVLKPGDTVFYRFDADMGFWGIPNIQRLAAYTPIGKATFEVCHNKEGNRDGEWAGASDCSTIVCLGGSHTWGIGVEQTERYTEALEQETGQQVVNLGHCSLGLDQICLAMMKRTAHYRPGVLVVEQYPWAVHRIVSNYVNGYLRPHFCFTGGGKLKLVKVSWWARFKPFRKLIGAFYDYRKALMEYTAGIDLQQGYDPTADPIFMLWKSHYYLSMYRLAEQIILVMRDYCRRERVKLLFALIPARQQFDLAQRSALVDYALPYHRFVDMLERCRIPYVDTAPDMLAAHSDSAPVIFSDGHLNARGHAVYADVIGRRIRSLGLKHA